MLLKEQSHFSLKTVLLGEQPANEPEHHNLLRTNLRF